MRKLTTASKRSYNQICPFARSLDFLGERWTLLIVRNLMIGPQRYKDLLDGLPGIGTNLLAARLKDLEKEGIIQRRKLPPPAGSTVYEFTELGRGLEQPLLDLARWGMWTLRRPAENAGFRPTWGALAMKMMFSAEAAIGIRETYELRLDDEVFTVRVDDGALEVTQGPAAGASAVLTSDGETWMAIASQSLSPQQALMNGRLKFEGDPMAMMRFRQMFPPPAEWAATSPSPQPGPSRR